MAELNEIFKDVELNSHICISEIDNTISFMVQEGPISEKGVNGCQVDDIIAACKTIVQAFNARFPCRENSLVITKLDEAMLWLMARNKDRIRRKVEGHDKS